ncbi:MAG: chemotaxis protein CheW [Xanthomonadaceae bacterium]|jgi:twitching motility protein PilI|nr:chemotaxis protein CheW [Xanthomonadaceae bacterium]
MRSPFDILAEYERRSLAHTVRMPVRELETGLWRGIGYRVGEHRLVSHFAEVVEIVALPTITPVPGTQPWLLGISNLRGNLFPVVDMKLFLEGVATPVREGQRVLIVHQDGGDAVLIIDELYGQRGFLVEQKIDPAAVRTGRYAPFIEGAFRGEDESVWGVFSLDRLGNTPQFRHAAA